MGEPDEPGNKIPAECDCGKPCDCRKPRDRFTVDIVAARGGCETALNRLFTDCRDYLLLVANRALAPELWAKASPSDIVQETLLQVKRNFARFEGASEDELLAWLRGVLLHNIQDTTRRYLGTKMRQVRREVSLDQGLNDSDLNFFIEASAASPQNQLVADEEAARLHAALGRLPDDYRQVIVLRHWGEQSFAQIGEKLGRSDEAARKLWSRAVERLKEELRGEPGNPGNSSHG